MTFTVQALRTCAGGGHVQIDVSIDGGPTVTRHYTRTELRDEAAVSAGELEARALHRLISEVKESTNGNPTDLQVRNALVGKTFEV